MRTVTKRIIRQVTDFEPIIAGFLVTHSDRMVDELPRGIWVCEDEGVPIAALLVYTDPAVRLSVVRRSDDDQCWTALHRLGTTAEDWFSSVGVTHYGMAVHSSDQKFCRLLERRGAIVIEEKDGWVEYLHTIARFRPILDNGIRPWDARDWTQLRRLVKDYLTSLGPDGGDILPTRHNVEEIIRSGVRAAVKGDPCLVGVVNQKLVGFCMWAGIKTALDTKEKTCQGWGTYIVPEHRQTGWSERLRADAIVKAKKAGYTVVEGIALSKIGLDTSKKIGFSVRGVVVSLRV